MRNNKRFAILQALANWPKQYPPSQAEIAAVVGLRSPSTVLSHLRQLEKDGYVKLAPRKGRTTVLTEQGRAVAKSGPDGERIVRRNRASRPLDANSRAGRIRAQLLDEAVDGYIEWGRAIKIAAEHGVSRQLVSQEMRRLCIGAGVPY